MFSFARGPRRERKHSAKQHSYKPSFEALENRLAPSGVTPPASASTPSVIVFDSASLVGMAAMLSSPSVSGAGPLIPPIVVPPTIPPQPGRNPGGVVLTHPEGNGMEPPSAVQIFQVFAMLAPVSNMPPVGVSQIGLVKAANREYLSTATNLSVVDQRIGARALPERQYSRPGQSSAPLAANLHAAPVRATGAERPESANASGQDTYLLPLYRVAERGDRLITFVPGSVTQNANSIALPEAQAAQPAPNEETRQPDAHNGKSTKLNLSLKTIAALGAACQFLYLRLVYGHRKRTSERESIELNSTYS